MLQGPRREGREEEGRAGKSLAEWLAFRLRFATPPAAASGKEYQTTDERCAACEIFGGPEPPCQNKGILADIREKTGRPCPRVELERENAVPADVVKFVMDERLAGFAPAHFDDWTSDWSPLERIETRNRIVEALTSKDVDLILRPRRPGAGLK